MNRRLVPDRRSGQSPMSMASEGPVAAMAPITGQLEMISVVVPCFRSQGTLEALCDRVQAAMRELGRPYELVLIEDCGGDRTWDVILQLQRTRENVRGIRLARNYGQHNALLAGIFSARGAWVVTIDDDLQNPPEEIGRLLAKVNEGFDVVYGKPSRQQHGLMRNLASSVTKLVLKGAMGAEVASHVSAFRIFRTELREAFSDYRGPIVNIDVLLTWGTRRYATTEVSQNERTVGESGYTLGKLVAHAMNMMTGFSVLPLQLAAMAGFLFATFGFGLLCYVVIRFVISGSPVPGFPFLASIVSMFSGIQLFALGIIGEYIARIHLRSTRQPPFVVAERAGL